MILLAFHWTANCTKISRLTVFFSPQIASPMNSPMKGSPARTPMAHAAQEKKPCCTALYDFDAENPGELSFKVIFARCKPRFAVSGMGISG